MAHLFWGKRVYWRVQEPHLVRSLGTFGDFTTVPPGFFVGGFRGSFLPITMAWLVCIFLMAKCVFLVGAATSLGRSYFWDISTRVSMEVSN